MKCSSMAILRSGAGGSVGRPTTGSCLMATKAMSEPVTRLASRRRARLAMPSRPPSLVPDACESAESARVAVQWDDAQEVAARHPKDRALEPAAELDGPQGNEPGGLVRHVVSLDVDVVTGLVVHRLNRGDQPGKRAGQRGELLLAGHRARRHAKRRRPERGGVGRMVAGNVDKQGGKPTAVHRCTLATTSRLTRQPGSLEPA